MRNLEIDLSNGPAGHTNGHVNGDTNGHTNGDVPHLNGHTNVNGNTPAPEPIAIVGIGLRLPNRIHSPQALWDLLVNKEETSGEIPSTRFNAAGFYSASRRPGSIGVQRGHFLDESDGLDRLDTSFFSLSKAEVEKLDPQQRMLLEVVWECMESGGQRDWRGSNTGVFVGTWGDDWTDFLGKDPQQTGGMLNVSGAGDFAISNRVSYEYDLQGPSMTIKAACASSMICLHQATQSLRDGGCDAAIVAGTNLILTPTTTIAQTEAGVISPTGQCRTFDAAADGYARGEAINAIYIKRLSDALRDGDPVRAVIRATAVNSDGRSAGISAPNPVAHEKMIRRAYAVAGLDNPGDTPFVEVHGTGTPSGDPLELQAIAGVFDDNQETYIGSVKANVGHGEGASGLTSIIKAVLMLENKTIPPQANFATPNPKIPFERARLVVPVTPTPWPEGRPERISVNSFGITGANAHAIVESVESYVSQAVQSNDSKLNGTAQLLLLSANTADSLKRRAADIQSYIETNPTLGADLAYTLSTRRTHLAHRAFTIAGRTLIGDKVKQTPRVSFVFTGQGAQWPAMGRELIEQFPDFHSDLSRLSDTLSTLPDPPAWNLIDELLKPAEDSRLHEAEFAQPLCTAIQIALVNFLARLGISPAAVVGHSSGEIGAAYAAGALTADEAIVVAYYRGRTAVNSPRAGGMAAVGMGRAEAALYLEDGVVVACDNSPNSITLSGDTEALDTVIAQMQADDPALFIRRLQTDGMAYHSHHMWPLGPGYQGSLDPLVKAKPVKVPFFSSVTGKLATETTTTLGAEYWRQNLESPVKFFPAVRALLESTTEDTLCVEIGPHSALAGPLRQIFQTTKSKAKLGYLPSLVRGKDAVESVLELCGQLFLHTVDINLAPLSPSGRLLTDLPAYPWQHDAAHWAETRAVKEWRTRGYASHELLGARLLEGNDVEPVWRNLLRLKDTSWLHDHRVLSDVVFPCAGYVAMAGEAIHQLTGNNDYSLRKLTIRTALILTDDRTVELMTSFRPYRSTDWYEFSIYSHNGTVWTKHCEGQARAGRDEQVEFESPVFTELPRVVESPYALFSRVGLHYGQTFQGLESVSAQPAQQRANAALRPPPVTSSDYALHPTTIDQCLQLLGMAAAEGLSHRFDRILLPTGIESLYIKQAGVVDTLQATAKATLAGNDVHGEMSVTSSNDNESILSIQGCQLSAFQQPDPHQEMTDRDDRIAAARLSWRPDLDFIPLNTLMVSRPKDADALRDMETYVFLCTLEIQARVLDTVSCAEHFDKFRVWIDDLVEAGRTDNHRLVPDSAALVDLTQEERLTRIQELEEQMKESEFAPAAELVTRLRDHCVDVFNGSTQILDVYLRDNGLTNLYAITGDRVDSTEFFVTAGHTNPTMRVLEIGAGTGGTTLLALQALSSINGEPMYGSYTFTDVSSGFFAAARSRFAGHPNLEFRTLDIGRDPLTQGFDSNSYDLIIASNVIHATNTLSTTLKHVRQLLHPRGRFFLQEHTPAAAKMINLIMGPLPGWWLGEVDDRPTEPVVSPERWEVELKGAGFTGIECVVYDDPNERDHIGVNIIARPERAASDFRAVTLLLRDEQQREDNSVTLVRDALVKAGYHIDECILGKSTLPVFQDVIALLEVDRPFVHSISAEDLAALQQVISSLGSSRCLWVLGSAQVGVVDPNYALTLGLTRSIRAELSPALATLEIDRVDADAVTTLVHVLEKFQDPPASANPETEYLLQNGVVHVGRYHWTQVSRELAAQETGEQALRLEVRRGVGREVTWVPYEPGTLGGNDITVIPAFAGVSSKDESVSVEGAGTIAAVGTEVKSLRVGDRVAVLGPNCLATSITVSADQVVAIPDSLSLEDAASLPRAFATALYSLVRVANIQRGQTVLIHASDGVGLAAVQICQMLGVEIYCTADNADHLNAFNIPRDHIFSSSDASFLPRLMAATGNRGVDVVLNSLTRELLQASWKCVAARGKMIELGRDRAQLDLDVFSGNRSLIGVDIAGLQDLYPELLNETINLYTQGHIRATPVLQDLTQRKDTILGTPIVAIPDTTTTTLSITPRQPTLHLRPDAAYLLIGGLGGLGQSISTYMVEHGARHFIYLSRNAGTNPEHQRFFRELESQGCTVQAIRGDIASLADVKKAVTKADYPIAGVLQMAMVLSDSPFLTMSYDDWTAALKPKVEGTWNLHHALLPDSQGQPEPNKVDFFVIFGSVSGSFGLAHQANYGAANTFQDAFVQYRHSQGQPASVLNIGAMADVGYVSQNRGVAEYLRNAGMPFMSESEFFAALHLSITQQSQSPVTTTTSETGRQGIQSRAGITSISQLAIGIRSTKPMDDPSNRVLWRHDKRVDIYRNIESAQQQLQGTEGGGTGKEEDKLAVFMSEVHANAAVLDAPETLALVTHEIGVTIYNFMLQPVDELDVSKALVTLGVDSLVIVEIRNWLRRRLEVEASTLEILNGGTIEMLGRICVERLKEKYPSS